MGISLFFTLCVTYSLTLAALSRMEPLSSGLHIPPETRQPWAQYSPFFSVQEYEPPPRNCTVTQVSIATDLVP